jgi:hypothetical protein
MPTESDAFFATLRSGLLGHAVSFRRLACDSLLLYIDCEPGDLGGITIWFEPIWHVRGPGGVLLGSRQVAEASDTEEAMAAVADGALAPLLGRRIEGVVVDSLTFDLGVSFEGSYGVFTFVADATADQSWHIRENATGDRLKGSPRGLAVVTGKRTTP